MVKTLRREHSPTDLSNEVHDWPSVCVVGLATFAVVTTEMLPVGLMTPIAGTLETSLGTAGLMISVPAILAAFFAPVVILVAGGVDRRHILAALLVLLTLANIASGFATSIVWLLGARIIVGFCMGGIWAVAGGLAPRLVPDHSIGIATAIIFGGVAAASVLGVPIGAIIGDFAGWRWAFGAMAVFSALVLILALLALPALPVGQSVRIGSFAALLERRSIQLGLVITFLFVSGHFMAFAFVRPMLETITGIGTEWIGILLFVYGAAGIIGNFLTGTIVTRNIRMVLIAIGLILSVSLLGFAMLGGTPLQGTVILILWGLAYGGVSVGLQTWMMKAAPSSIEVATSLFVSIFNLGIAFGSFAGGLIINHFDLHTTLLIAASLPMVGVLFVLARQSVVSLPHKSGANKPC